MSGKITIHQINLQKLITEKEKIVNDIISTNEKNFHITRKYTQISK